MEESKIVKYIFSFPSKEKEKFVQFVNSPFFNQHKKTKELLDIILKEEHKKRKQLSKELVFKKLFPEATYNEQKLYNLLSNLKKLFNRFLGALYLEEHPQMAELFTLESTFKHHQFDLLKNRAKQLQKKLESKQSQDDNAYFIRYRINNLLGYYGGVYEKRSKSSNVLQQMMDDLDRFYILEKLKNACHLYAHYINMNAQYNWNLLDEILDHIKASPSLLEEDLSIHLYYTILMSLRESENPDYYSHLKEMLQRKINEFSQDELFNLYFFCNNYCIRQINQGNNKYLVELFDLYKKALDRKIIFQEGLISQWDYKNITTIGAQLKEFEWTEWFVHEHRDKLPANHRENAYKYNLAYLYYAKEDYQEALSNLLHVKFTSDVKYYLSSSFLLLRTYFKLKDTEALLSLIDTIRIFVLRNKDMTTIQKKSSINFLKLVKKLVLLKHHYHTYSKSELAQKLTALKGQITQTEPLDYKSWLLRECEN